MEMGLGKWALLDMAVACVPSPDATIEIFMGCLKAITMQHKYNVITMSWQGGCYQGAGHQHNMLVRPQGHD